MWEEWRWQAVGPGQVQRSGSQGHQLLLCRQVTWQWPHPGNPKCGDVPPLRASTDKTET